MKYFRTANISGFFLNIKFLFSIILSGILLSQTLFAKEASNPLELKLNKLIQNGSYIVLKKDSPILSYNTDKQFIPASIWKIVTALGALETLGGNYRFKTEFFLSISNDLYIKGFGDPFLVSEEIELIYGEMIKKGLIEINNIYLDASSFNVPEPPPGVSASLNPYDVTNGALAVNFNTINFYIDKKGEIISAEKQTPTLKLMKDLGKGFTQGKHRINISRSPENITRHTGELFRALQHKLNISGSGTETTKNTPSNLTPFYIHYSSKTLKEIIKEMMLYSNNYIANQIYLTMGARKHGYPATWEKSQDMFREYLDRSFPGYTKAITFDEGSGISRNNMITAGAMTEVLKRFKPYARLLPLEGGRLIKSGTLKGVYSYAGYFFEGDSYDSFVIILNQKRNNRDTVLGLMEQHYKVTH